MFHRSSISRPKVDTCELCKKGFNIIHKQHECKRCSRAICHDCGKNKAFIPKYDIKTEHRICNICKEEQGWLQELKAKHQLSFSRNSDLSRKWMKSIMDQFNEANVIENYKQQLEKGQKNPNDKIKAVIQQHLLRTYRSVVNDFNFSFYEWHYMLTQKENEEIVKSKLANVLNAYFQTYPIQISKVQQKISDQYQNLILIALFFFYFCDEAFVYNILDFLHQYIIPQQYQYYKIIDEEDEKRVFNDEVLQLQNFIKDNELLPSNMMQDVQQFLEENTTQFFSSLTINKLNFSVSFSIMNEILMKKEFFELEKFYCLIISQSQKYLKKAKADSFKQFIVRSINFKQLKDDQSKIMKRQSMFQKSNNDKGDQQLITPSEQKQQSVSIGQAPSIPQQNQQQQQSHSLSETQLKPIIFQQNEEQNMIILVIDALNELVSEKGNEKYKQLLDKVTNENVSVTLQSIVQEIKNKDQKITKFKNKIKEMQDQIEEFKNREIEEMKIKDLYGELSKLKNENVNLSTQLKKTATIDLNIGTMGKQEYEKMQSKLVEIQQQKKECATLNFRLKEDNENLKKEITLLRQQNNEIQHFVNETKKQMDQFLEENEKQKSVQPMGEKLVEVRINHLQECLTQKERELYELRFSQIRINQQFVAERDELSQLRKLKTELTNQITHLKKQLDERQAQFGDDETNAEFDEHHEQKSDKQENNYKPLKERKNSEECTIF